MDDLLPGAGGGLALAETRLGCDAGTDASCGLGELSAELVPRVLFAAVAADGVSGSRYGALAYTVVPAAASPYIKPNTH